MPASQDHVGPGTPMGANLVPGGCTFRLWAPHAHAVHVVGEFNGRVADDNSLLVKDAATKKYHIAPESHPGTGSEAGR